MEVSEVRRRLRAAVDQARRDASARRERTDLASHAYDRFLAEHAVPIFQTLATALTGEGFRYKLSTPAGSVRLSSESSADFVEVGFDKSQDPAAVLVRTSRGRGRRQIETERSIAAGPAAIETLTDDLLLGAVLDEMVPLLER
jgi:hypothetical protein